MTNSKDIIGALPIGTVIHSSTNEYIVLEVLGAGGFGITYKVIRQGNHQILALKEYFPNKLCERGDGNTMSYLNTNASTVKAGIEDFITEAKRLNRQNISHPNIVSIDEVFKANGTAYYTMEYVEGDNLLQFIKGNHNKPLSIEQALDIMRPIMQAVALLHKHKLTHLDIKHENVILSKESDGSYRPVLIDFGQAKHYDKKGNATSELTNAGCSDGFAPPEQYLGLSQFTPQADVYALCATLLYLLTAKQPVKSSDINASLITDMLPADTPSYITTAIINGMRRDKDDRIQSVESLADSLRINLSEIDDNVNSTIKLHIENKHKRNNLLKLNNPLMWFFAICLISAIGGIIWYSNSFHSSQDDNSSHSSRDELFDYNNPSIHYSKDILDKCQDIAFYEHTREDDVYHFNSFYEHTHHFNFYVEDGGFMFYGLDSLDTIRFEPDVEITRLENEILLSDKVSKLIISVSRNNNGIKVYNIQYQYFINEVETIYYLYVDSILYYDTPQLYYDTPYTICVEENLSGDDYTALDFIELILKKLNFKINYK